MKPTYSIIAKCSGDKEDFRKWRNVTNLKTFNLWLSRNFPQWRFYNIYDKKTRELIECIKQK